jgi:hypothetical protein
MANHNMNNSINNNTNYNNNNNNNDNSNDNDNNSNNSNNCNNNSNPAMFNSMNISQSINQVLYNNGQGGASGIPVKGGMPLSQHQAQSQTFYIAAINNGIPPQIINLLPPKALQLNWLLYQVGQKQMTLTPQQQHQIQKILNDHIEHAKQQLHMHQNQQQQHTQQHIPQLQNQAQQNHSQSEPQQSRPSSNPSQAKIEPGMSPPKAEPDMFIKLEEAQSSLQNPIPSTPNTATSAPNRVAPSSMVAPGMDDVMSSMLFSQHHHSPPPQQQQPPSLLQQQQHSHISPQQQQQQQQQQHQTPQANPLSVQQDSHAFDGFSGALKEGYKDETFGTPDMTLLKRETTNELDDLQASSSWFDSTIDLGLDAFDWDNNDFVKLDDESNLNLLSNNSGSSGNNGEKKTSDDKNLIDENGKLCVVGL